MDQLEFARQEGRTVYWRFVDDGSPIKKPPRELRRVVHTLGVSDMHIGSTLFEARPFRAMLNTFWVTHYVIVNGDGFQGSRVLPLSPEQRHDERKAFSRLHKLDDPESDAQMHVIWNEGNHDWEFLRLLAAHFGFDVRDEIITECGGKRHLWFHGDRYDHFVSNRPILTQGVVWLHELVQKLDRHNRKLLRYVDQQAGAWSRETETVAQGAVEYGRKLGVDYVHCGHTHQELIRIFPDITYDNSGSWTKRKCSFITVTEDGSLLNIVELS